MAIDLAHLAQLDLNLLVALDALLSERSVTRAAARVGLRQSAMSHALARLRVVFADELLTRAPDGMRPTPRAVALEAPEQVRSKANGNFGPITEIKVRKDSGRMYFCAHETYCYDSNAFELISACRIKRDSDMGDPASFSFFTR